MTTLYIARRLYGHVWRQLVAVTFVCTGAAFPAQAQVKETVLYAFSGGNDGQAPFAGVIADERGALYGTAEYGGINNPACLFYCGVVFKLTPAPAPHPPWSETTLWSFSGGNDGANPFGGLFAPNESPSHKKTLYGTTSFNGQFGNGSDLPPKEWTGLGRHTPSESWADVAQSRVQAAGIVEALDILEEVSASLGAESINPMVNSLVFRL